MKPRAVAAILAALCVLTAEACGRANAFTESAATLPAEWFTLQHQDLLPDAKGLVYLIGENHASVEGQIHLAKLLQKLLDEGRIGAVLVEGSNGKIEADSLRQAVTRDFSPDQLERYWHRELEEGRIAGYEYVALTRDGLRVQGVEDMGAKHRYELTAADLSGKWWQDEVAAHERAATSLREGIAALPGAAASLRPTLERGLASYGDAASSYAAAAQELAAASKPYTESQRALLDVYFSYNEVIDGIGREKIEEIQRKQAAVQPQIDEHNRLVAELRALGNSGDSDTAQRLVGRLSTLRSSIEPVVAELQRFEESHSADFEKLKDLGASIDQRKTQLEKEGKALEAPRAVLDKLARALQDRYFELGNGIVDAARDQYGPNLERCPANLRAKLDRVSHFFGEDSRWREEEDLRAAPAELAERDERMSANVAAFMKESGIDRVAVIIGHAHLPGMMAGLRAQKVALVAGAVKPLDASEKWEEAAWSERRNDQEAVFAPASPEGLKEISRLLGEIWRKEQEARLAFFHQSQRGGSVAPILSAGNEALFEGVGKPNSERVLLLGDLLPDQRAGGGTHIVARGWDPASNREFQVWDRRILRDQVKELSGERTEYVYLYRAAQDGKPTYRVVTSHGEYDLKDRSARAVGAAGGGPDYVVVVAEPHAAREGDRVVEPGWEAVRGSGGDGRKPPGNGPGSSAADADGPGKGPGKGGSDGRDSHGAHGGGSGGGRDGWAAGFFGDGEGKRRRTAVLRTVDAARARDHIAILRGQKPLEAKDVTIVEEGTSLSSIHFSPSSGEHAGMVVFLARNVDQFRRAVAEAAKDGKLENKQVGLITCGDAWRETAALRETLLASGALLVWTPDRQITPQAGRLLVDQIRTTLGRAEAQGTVFRDLDALITHAITEVTTARKDPDATSLWDSSSHVRLEEEDVPGTHPVDVDRRS